METVDAARIGQPIEIRVSPAAIIEVYGSGEIAGQQLHEELERDTEFGSAWEESFAAQRDVRQAMERYRRLRRAKHLLAYTAFLIAAMLVVWCAVR